MNTAAEFAGGIPLGAPLADVRLGEDDHLLDRLGRGFALLGFAGPEGPDTALLATLRSVADVPLASLLVSPRPLPGIDVPVVVDPEGRVAARYAASPGAAYRARPDTHVCARWTRVTPAALRAALDTACAGGSVR